MNPRILKKLSKRADPIVRKLVTIDRFVINDSRDRQIDSSQRMEKKHWERWGKKPNRYGYFKALMGTVGYGKMQGYYEREWEENDAYSILKNLVADHFTDWESFDYESDEYPKCSINISNPSVVFEAAKQLAS